RPHPRLLLPPRGPPGHRCDPRRTPDRPPAAPRLRQGPAQRGPGRPDGPRQRTRRRLRRGRHQRRLRLHPDLRPALLGPHRRGAHRPDAHPPGGQWVAFPTFSQLDEAVFSMVVAGRMIEDDVAIMMVEAESTDNSWNLIKEQGVIAPTEEVVAEGLEAAKVFVRTLCVAQQELADTAAKPVREFPLFLDHQPDAYEIVETAAAER